MTDAPSSFLQFKDVCIDYGKTQTIFDVNLAVEQGVTFGLIGLNGAGKTTLIKTLLGLHRLAKGEILLQGRVSSQPANRRILAYLPEKFDPPSFLKGDEFIRFSTRLYNVPFDKDRMLNLASRLRLDVPALPRRITTYSKGMRQKLGLMATVMTNCNLLILDEPMSGLDPAARAAVKDLLLQLKGEGRTIFFSSHILSDMDEICDHVAVLHHGRILYDGTPSDLKIRGQNENLERAFLSLIGVGLDTRAA